ncbi:MAG: hypothetical protein ACK5LE_06900 [Alphaproteobacteria bacterium]
MSFINCINDHVLNGRLTAEYAENVLDLFTENKNKLSEHLSAAEANLLAAQRTSNALRIKNARSKVKKLKQVKAQMKITEDLKKFNQVQGMHDEQALRRSIMGLYSQDRLAPYTSAEMMMDYQKGMAFKDLSEFLEKHDRDLLGRIRNKEDLEMIGHELFNKNTGNDYANRTAQTLKKVFEDLRLNFNELGGDISFRKDWNIPQSHSTIKVRAAGKDAYLKIYNMLDFERMFDEETGMKWSEFTRAERLAKLEGVYDEIASNHTLFADDTPQFGNKALANKHNDPRTLQFKDFDAWKQYNELYGEKGLLDTITSHIERMTSEIGIMQRLGPNPEATKAWLENLIDKTLYDMDTTGSLKKSRYVMDKQRSTKERLNKLHGEITGQNFQVINEKVNNIIKGTKDIWYASKLGGAVVTALPTDLGLSTYTMKRLGVSTSKMLTYYGKEVKKSGRHSQAELNSLGFHVEVLAKQNISDYRVMNAASNINLTQQIADTSMKTSGLVRHTEANRKANIMVMADEFAQSRNKTFDALNEKMRIEMGQHGIGDAEWNIVRNSKPHNLNGVELLMPLNITDADVALKYFSLLSAVRDQGVLMPNAAITSYFRGGSKGTLAGIFMESVAMLKSFPIAMIQQHFMRIMDMNPTLAMKAARTSQLFAVLTLSGMFATIAKDYLKGENPINKEYLSSKKFWFEAMSRGGALPIVDYFVADNRNYGDPAAGAIRSTVGPLIADPITWFTKAQKEFGEMSEGNSRDVARRMFSEATQYIPGQSHWYLRLFVSRMGFEQIKTVIDPDYRSMLEKYNRQNESKGIKYWWRPGQIMPGG